MGEHSLVGPERRVKDLALNKLFHIHPFVDHQQQSFVKAVYELDFIFILQSQQEVYVSLNAENRVLLESVVDSILTCDILLEHVHLNFLLAVGPILLNLIFVCLIMFILIDLVF